MKVAVGRRREAFRFLSSGRLRPPFYVGLRTALELHGAAEVEFEMPVIVFTPGCYSSRHYAPRLKFTRLDPFAHGVRQDLYEWGIVQYPLRDGSSLPVSDLERTLLDMFYRPVRVGGLTPAAELLGGALQMVDFDRLLSWAPRMGKERFPLRRLGYLLEQLYPTGTQDFLSRLERLAHRGTNWALLDPSSRRRTGVTSERWRIIDNAGLQE